VYGFRVIYVHLDVKFVFCRVTSAPVHVPPERRRRRTLFGTFRVSDVDRPPNFILMKKTKGKRRAVKQLAAAAISEHGQRLTRLKRAQWAQFWRHSYFFV
jgi:hypothetical protein